jgi:hypothetical protein
MNNQIQKKYTFIYPTKTGGTACQSYFKNFYSNYIKGEGHNNKCKNTNNPIIIVRDVYDRFLSMYKYWKNGAIDTEYKRGNVFLHKYKNVTIKDYISFIKEKKKDLNHVFTWEDHYKPLSFWINNTEYKNIIIVKYHHELNDKIQMLIDKLNIPNKHIPLPKVNISKDNNELICLDEDDKNFIASYFNEDIQLIETINNHPELFKMVI